MHIVDSVKLGHNCFDDEANKNFSKEKGSSCLIWLGFSGLTESSIFE